MFECVRGTDKGNTKQVLDLLRACADGMQRMAVHGRPGASYHDVAMNGTLVYGNADEDALMAGNHEGHWHPCML